jgi:hypothetical protein
MAFRPQLSIDLEWAANQMGNAQRPFLASPNFF